MVRKLKYHEQKLLKKVDFISWKVDNLNEIKVMKKYDVKKREDYTIYNKLSREIRHLANMIADLDPKLPFRDEVSAKLLEKLYMMGLIPRKSSLELAQHVSASSFCRRRLPVVMVRNRMVKSLHTATQFVEHGHVRVGVELIKDPAFIVTRNMQDFITWVNASAIKKQIVAYENMVKLTNLIKVLKTTINDTMIQQQYEGRLVIFWKDNANKTDGDKPIVQLVTVRNVT